MTDVAFRQHILRVLRYVFLFALPGIVLVIWIWVTSLFPHDPRHILGEPISILAPGFLVVLNPEMARARSRAVLVVLWAIGIVAWIPVLGLIAYLGGLIFYDSPIA